MGKKKAIQAKNSLNKVDNALYYFIAISIFIISFINRIKKFTFYYAYDFQSSLGAVFNTFTYYKLICLMVLFIAALVIFIYRNIKFHTKFKLDATTVGILLIIISSIIATLFTDLKKEAIWGFYTRTNGLMAYVSLFSLFVIISKLNISEKQLNFISHGTNFVSIVIVIIGIMDFFGYSIFTMDWYKDIYIPSELRSILKVDQVAPTFVASSILGQPNYFGAYCSIIFPFITIQAMDAKKCSDKILFSVGSVLLFLGTYISASVGPWITLLAILALILISYKHWKSYIHISVLLLFYLLISSIFIKYNLKNAPWVINQFLVIIKPILKTFNYKLVIFIIPVIIFLIIYYKYKNMNKYKFVSVMILLSILISIFGFTYLLQNVVPNHMDMFSNRGYAWHYTYEMLKENFIIGYGPDTFYYNFPQNNPDAMVYSKNIVFDKPHNVYLQVFIDNGLLGIAGFMILLVSTLLLLLKTTYSSKNSNTITYSKAAFFTTIAYMIQGITNDNNMGIQPILYLLLATGIAIGRKENLTQSSL